MKKVHNFYAGPSILPEFTYQETIKAIENFAGTGLSIMSISHRSKQFEATLNEATGLFKKLLNIPDGYSVLFLGGGASLQFAMIPFNLMIKKAMYLDTGTWSNKAIKEAKLFGDVEVISSKDKNYSYVPKGFSIPSDADYFHFTSNNTIAGTEIKHDFDSPIPMIADMSSDIFSRPVDVSKYAMIYGGAQKNLGPAGVTFVIIKDDILGKTDRKIPTMLNYQIHIDKGSMFNTPPAMNIFATLQTLKWIDQQGGVEVMQKMNIEKAQILYDAIDNSKLFVVKVDNVEDRSLMNITFVMKEEYKNLEADFLAFASEKGMLGVKGHRSVGGFRASTYNALPKESVIALVETMKEFEKSI
ncbi:MAG: 3-phosphoserine/phosphohydroxythreonine transaminase [Bacteroidales bacterium]|nr:3-phosphoserine/phosphohydroxythreonine transaminase [Bacteroidales bacterium]